MIQKTHPGLQGQAHVALPEFPLDEDETVAAVTTEIKGSPDYPYASAMVASR